MVLQGVHTTYLWRKDGGTKLFPVTTSYQWWLRVYVAVSYEVGFMCSFMKSL